MTWQHSRSSVAEYETADKRKATARMKKLQKENPNTVYYIMEIVNPKQDNSNRFTVCRETWRKTA